MTIVIFAMMFTSGVIVGLLLERYTKKSKCVDLSNETPEQA